jgi:hypothetical protein
MRLLPYMLLIGCLVGYFVSMSLCMVFMFWAVVNRKPDCSVASAYMVFTFGSNYARFVLTDEGLRAYKRFRRSFAASLGFLILSFAIDAAFLDSAHIH